MANPLPVGIFSRTYHSLGCNIDASRDLVSAGVGKNNSPYVESSYVTSSAQIIPGTQRASNTKLHITLFFMIRPSFQVGFCWSLIKQGKKPFWLLQMLRAHRGVVRFQRTGLQRDTWPPWRHCRTFSLNLDFISHSQKGLDIKISFVYDGFRERL